MAVIKSLWLGSARKKLGGAVTYQLKGQQIVRKEAASVSNPRTTAQMDQRIRLANLVNFYRANKSWMAKGAFENKEQRWSDYNAFVSTNLSSNRVFLTKSQASKGVAVAAPYKVTAGSLPELQASENSGTMEVAIQASEAPTTLGALSQAIISRYPGIQNGDQLSIIQYNSRVDTDGDELLYVSPSEIILNTESSELLTAVLPNWTFSTTTMSSPSGSDAVAFSICVSRSVGGKIKVSPSWVVVIDETYGSDYVGDTAMQNAINSYGGSSVNFLDNQTIGLSSVPEGNTGGGGASGPGDPGDVTP